MVPASLPVIFTCLIVVVLKFPVTVIPEKCTKEVVLIKPHADVKFFAFPTSDEPIMTWMDIQKGIYPNTTHIESSLEVGEPITIFIYLKDASKLFDIMATDCWAYDNQNFEKSQYKLHLTEEHPQRRYIGKWFKVENPKGSVLKSYMYTNINSFKFPDKDQIYLKCDIQLCFQSCDKLVKKLT